MTLGMIAYDSMIVSSASSQRNSTLSFGSLRTNREMSGYERLPMHVPSMHVTSSTLEGCP